MGDGVLLCDEGVLDLVVMAVRPCADTENH